MRDLLRHLTDALERGREPIVCQVVETRGSTPQKAGALMIVDPDGGQVGTLGGGCVEAEVKQKADRGGSAGRGRRSHAFVLDHDYAWADGLICGGKMVITAEALRGPGPLAYLPGLSARCSRPATGSPRPSWSTPTGSAPASRPGARFLFGAGRRAASRAGRSPRRPSGLAGRVAPLDDRPRPAVRGGRRAACRPCRGSGW